MNSRNALKIALLAAVAVAALGVAVDADARRGGHGHGHRGHGHAHFSFWFGAPFFAYPYYYPRYHYYYPPAYYYPPTVAIPGPSSAPVYIEQNPPAAAAPAAPADGPGAYWYYCRDTQTYYPYVQQCASPWQQVVPQSVPPTAEPRS